MASKRKNDIFDVLSRADTKQNNYYSTLDEEQKKDLSMWMLMRWMSSSKGNTEHHLLMVNDLLNDGFSSLSKHPELQWKILCVCGVGKKQYHQWIAPPKRLSLNKREKAVSQMMPHLKRDEIETMLMVMDDKELVETMKDHGYQDSDISEIIK